MNLIWFRNDLRIQANPAVAAVMSQGTPAIAVVCLTPESWDEHRESPRRIGLWRARLLEVEKELSGLGIALKVINAEHFNKTPEKLLAFAQAHSVEQLFFNREYPLNEALRDQSVVRLLSAQGVKVSVFDGELIIPPGEVLTGQGEMFKVYTPFARAWRRRLVQFDSPIIPVKGSLPQSGEVSDSVPKDLNWQSLSYDPEYWPVDSDSIRQRVYAFVEERESDYALKRDYPAVRGTSELSPYLTIGAISPRQLMHLVSAKYRDDSWLESSWLNELIWREFYRHLMQAYPALSRFEPFRPDVEARIRWQKNDQYFEAWCRGETGFPIIDAAMKQLRATGWMHNRLRMVVASFLTKLAGIDWRDGERFFIEQLIDADFSSNLGGWQWSASVGADAAPYFRIFNPTAQSKKFDPEGEFLIRWLPELAGVPAKLRHEPGAGQALGRPAPILDYKLARQRSLSAYQSAE